MWIELNSGVCVDLDSICAIYDVDSNEKAAWVQLGGSKFKVSLEDAGQILKKLRALKFWVRAVGDKGVADVQSVYEDTLQEISDGKRKQV